ncbi:hypothetical protein V8C34DRAFT_316737 [Trichoderma compactum]
MHNRGEKLKKFSFLILICSRRKTFALGHTASPASPRDASVFVKLNTRKPPRTSRGLLTPGTSLSSHLLKSSYQRRPICCCLASHSVCASLLFISRLIVSPSQPLLAIQWCLIIYDAAVRLGCLVIERVPLSATVNLFVHIVVTSAM